MSNVWKGFWSFHLFASVSLSLPHTIKSRWCRRSPSPVLHQCRNSLYQIPDRDFQFWDSNESFLNRLHFYLESSFLFSVQTCLPISAHDFGAVANESNCQFFIYLKTVVSLRNVFFPEKAPPLPSWRSAASLGVLCPSSLDYEDTPTTFSDPEQPTYSMGGWLPHPRHRVWYMVQAYISQYHPDHLGTGN